MTVVEGLSATRGVARGNARRPSVVRNTLRMGRVKVGLTITVAIVLLVIVGPLVGPSPYRFVGAPFAAPGVHGLFGTDYLGRSVLGRFLAGGRSIMFLSAIAAILSAAGGAGWGMTAAYRGGWVDESLMRFGDVILALPQIVFALLFLSILGSSPPLLVFVAAVSQAPRTARVMRAAALNVMEKEFVQDAEAIGMPRWRIVLGEILPNVTSPLMVELGLRFSFSVGLLASLGFLGLGVPPPTPDWGMMVNENVQGLTVSPYGVLLPVIAIALICVGVSLITDGFARASIGIDRTVEL
jgi:peptide/nickel transport system permease protein